MISKAFLFFPWYKHNPHNILHKVLQSATAVGKRKALNARNYRYRPTSRVYAMKFYFPTRFVRVREGFCGFQLDPSWHRLTKVLLSSVLPFVSSSYPTIPPKRWQLFQIFQRVSSSFCRMESRVLKNLAGPWNNSRNVTSKCQLFFT